MNLLSPFAATSKNDQDDLNNLSDKPTAVEAMLSLIDQLQNQNNEKDQAINKPHGMNNEESRTTNVLKMLSVDNE